MIEREIEEQLVAKMGGFDRTRDRRGYSVARALEVEEGLRKHHDSEERGVEGGLMGKRRLEYSKEELSGSCEEVQMVLSGC